MAQAAASSRPITRLTGITAEIAAGQAIDMEVVPVLLETVVLIELSDHCGLG